MTKYHRSALEVAGLLLWWLVGLTACGQGLAAKEPQIQDNSFLIEEGYNQETRVVQHINTFSRMWNSRDWNYTFTQEWPAPWSWRHQLSYTLAGVHAGAFRGSGGGAGDAILNYRYQLVGTGDARLAFAPRFSILLPFGDVGKGRGTGAVGVQTNLPMSVVLHRRLVTHWNAGATLVPHARNADQARAGSIGYNLGQSFVFVVHPRLNFLLETSANNFQSVIAPGKTEWSKVRYISPGSRWAFNFKNGMQIVPGIALPIGFCQSRGERGLFVYLSIEHPFGKLSE